MAQRYLRQKMILMQKNRESVQAMFEINQALRMLKAEHDNVVIEIKNGHQQEIDELNQMKNQ